MLNTQIASALTNFADAFQQFYNSGQEHLASANKITKSMKELASLCSNRNGSAISNHFTQVDTAGLLIYSLTSKTPLGVYWLVHTEFSSHPKSGGQGICINSSSIQGY